MSNRVSQQVRVAPGLTAYGLRADILHRRFWTFSAWSSAADIAAFVQAEPHRTAMRFFATWAAPGFKTARWQTTTPTIVWADILKRLEDTKPQ